MNPLIRLASVASILCAAPAAAALLPAFQITGNVGSSVDGVGTNSTAGGFVQALIPVGATIERAYFYSAGIPSGFGGPSTLAAYNSAGITLAGTAITSFDTLVGATSTRADIDRWFTARADVTSLIASLVAGAAGTNFSFSVTEGTLNTRIDGSVLAIAYSLPSLPQGSVIFLDGGQNTGGETTTVNFASPITNPMAPDFAAQLGLGISFSCCTQQSTVNVNGSTLTNFAGNFNDGAAQSDGSLITVGGLGDNPGNNVASYADDDELYNLAPFINPGDTSLSIFTNNATNDDNIFFAHIYTTAIASVPGSGVPEPATWAMMVSGFGLLGASLRRRRVRVAIA